MHTCLSSTTHKDNRDPCAACERSRYWTLHRRKSTTVTRPSVTFPPEKRGTEDGRLIERSSLHSSIMPTFVPSELFSGESRSAVFGQAGPSRKTSTTEGKTDKVKMLGSRLQSDNLKPEASTWIRPRLSRSRVCQHEGICLSLSSRVSGQLEQSRTRVRQTSRMMLLFFSASSPLVLQRTHDWQPPADRQAFKSDK